jgi:MarR family transcriptional regulator, transcriptional regulator for hemolysin
MAELSPTSQELRLTSPLLGYLERRIRVEAESELAAFGLRPRHVIALTVLRQIGEGSQADLATALRIDRTNLVGLLNELEDQELVERQRSHEDRRRHTVVLTAAGIDRLGEVEAALAKVEARVLAGLDGDEQATLYSLLEQATAGLGVSCSEPPPPGDC